MIRNSLIILLLSILGAAACSSKLIPANSQPGTVCDSLQSHPADRLLFDIRLQAPAGYHPGDPLTNDQEYRLKMDSKDLIVSFDLRSPKDTAARLGNPSNPDFTYGPLLVKAEDVEAILAKPYIQALYFHSQLPQVTRLIPKPSLKPRQASYLYDVRGARWTAGRVYLVKGWR